MRLNEAEKGRYYKIRNVSELRTQYQCEYRLHLKHKLGNSQTPASVTGTELHQRVLMKSDNRKVENSGSQLMPLLVIVVTLIVGFLWIFW